MKLAELKQKFTELTGVPARKQFALLVCTEGCLEGRRMLSRLDWEHAIANISKKLVAIEACADTEETIADEKESVEPLDEPLDEDSLVAQELLCDPDERVAIRNAKELIQEGNYKALAMLLHPDTTKLPKEVAKVGFYRLQKAKEQSSRPARPESYGEASFDPEDAFF